MTEAIRITRDGGSGVPTYARLGVRTFINCKGTYTMLGGSLPLNEVARAMEEAGRSYVNMQELHDAAGHWLADQTGAEWGLVTSGASAALCLVTAACITGGDPDRMLRLPDASGMPHVVITQASHRSQYELSVRMTGARVVEVSTAAALKRTVDESTAMILFLGEAREAGELTLRDLAEAARERRVPLVVDAAAERPDRPDYYLSRGADAVIYSGGKCLRGPQDTGLILGRKDLLRAAFRNAAPHDALGRPMKVSKESLMGLLAAVALWYRRDHEKEWAMWEEMLRHISDRLSELPAVHTAIRQPPLPSNVAPTLGISWDRRSIPLTNARLQDLLRQGDPSIEVPLDGDGISIMPYMMEPGQERPVAREIRKQLDEAAAAVAAAVAAGGGGGGSFERQDESFSIAGTWRLEIRFDAVTSAYRMVLQERDGAVSGTMEGTYGSAEVEGRRENREAELCCTIRCGANAAGYTFAGRFAEEEADGVVDAGQYGSYRWHAARIDGDGS